MAVNGDSVEVELRVGMLDLALAKLMTEDHHTIEFPTILLPENVEAGSIIKLQCSRAMQTEKADREKFAAVQQELLDDFAINLPKTPVLRARNVTQTSVVLEWDPIEIATSDLHFMALYKGTQRLGVIPQPLKRTVTKVSNLEIDSPYDFHLVLSTSAGDFESNKLDVKTHKMTDLTGVVVCIGSLSHSAIQVAELQETLDKLGCKPPQDSVKLDTTHFICSTEGGPAFDRAVELNIPVVRPEWLKACEKERRLVSVRGFYLSETPTSYGTRPNVTEQTPESQAPESQAPESQAPEAQESTHEAQGASQGSPDAEQPVEEQPVEEQPVEEQPVEEQPVEEHQNGEQATNTESEPQETPQEGLQEDAQEEVKAEDAVATSEEKTEEPETQLTSPPVTSDEADTPKESEVSAKPEESSIAEQTSETQKPDEQTPSFENGHHEEHHEELENELQDGTQPEDERESEEHRERDAAEFPGNSVDEHGREGLVSSSYDELSVAINKVADQKELGELDSHGGATAGRDEPESAPTAVSTPADEQETAASNEAADISTERELEKELESDPSAKLREGEQQSVTLEEVEPVKPQSADIDDTKNLGSSGDEAAKSSAPTTKKSKKNKKNKRK